MDTSLTCPLQAVKERKIEVANLRCLLPIMIKKREDAGIEVPAQLSFILEWSRQTRAGDWTKDSQRRQTSPSIAVDVDVLIIKLECKYLK